MAVIGIDLGTTNSIVAHMQDGKPTLIENIFGEALTPSVISIDKSNNVLIGKPAQHKLITHPKETISCFKRNIGTDKKYEIHNKSYSSIELSSLILQSLKKDAERILGEPVTEAIISVPAYFNETQRKATIQAASLVGLKVERIINEPTAAALAYGIHELNHRENMSLVLDLGGGTFDVSLLEYFEGVVEVQASSGDSQLGGEDFTDVLIQDFKDQFSISQLSPTEKSQLYSKMDSLKKELSSSLESSCTLTINNQEFEYSCTQEKLESLCQDLVLRIKSTTERAIRDSRTNTDEIDNIILVGGATRMSLIKKIVIKMFGKHPICHLNPDEVVGLGAAVQAGLKMRDQALNDLILTDVTPFSLGVDTILELDNGSIKEGYFAPIIERNATIPVSKVDQFTTVKDNQTKIELKIYQGESRLIANNIYLGELAIPVPKNKKGEEIIDVRFTYDINGLLEVEVKSQTTGKKSSIVIEKNPGTLSKHEIRDQLAKLSHLKIHPADQQKNRELLARAERYYMEFTGAERDLIHYEAATFEAALDSQNPQKVEKAYKRFISILDEYNIDWGLDGK